MCHAGDTGTVYGMRYGVWRMASFVSHMSHVFRHRPGETRHHVKLPATYGPVVGRKGWCRIHNYCGLAGSGQMFEYCPSPRAAGNGPSMPKIEILCIFLAQDA